MIDRSGVGCTKGENCDCDNVKECGNAFPDDTPKQGAAMSGELDNREKARAVAKSTTAASFRLEKGEPPPPPTCGQECDCHSRLLAGLHCSACDPPHDAKEQCVFCASQGEAVTVSVDSPDGCPHVFVGRRWLPGEPE